MTALNPTGLPVRIGLVQLRTPGLSGSAEIHAAGSPGMRAAEQSTQALEKALAAASITSQMTLEIQGAKEVPVPAGVTTRSTTFGEPAMELTVPDAGKDWGQFVLYQDEAGVMTWNFPVDEANRLDVTRGSTTRRYLIRRTVPPAEHKAGTRGLLGAIGKKLLKVLAYKLIDPIAGAIGPHFLAKFEAAKRPYRVRTFTPANYNQPATDADTLTAADWTRLQQGRSLLMIHGTNSCTHSAFGALDAATVQALSTVYGGRVWAFDHFTLSEDPVENIRKLIAFIPDGAALDVDIICHSRGGLVARQLSEEASQTPMGTRRITVQRIVFVAVPNAGTTLTDTKHMSDFIDSYTNILNFVPDNGVTDTFEGLITIAKMCAVGVVKGLDGLQSMNPTGPYLHGLNTSPKAATRYFALASNYEPVVPGWKAWAADRLLDKVFAADNDLVVPTDGVFAQNGSGLFPIVDPFVFKPEDGVCHTQFFGRPEVRARLIQWLA